MASCGTKSESGLFLGYSEVDAYAWSFGTNLAAKYYPGETFKDSKDGYPENLSLPWRKLGKTRLKKVIPKEEYKYVIAAYPPAGDPIFESE